MKPITFIIVACIAVLLSFSPVAALVSGEKEHKLFGGSSGDVSFAHEMHQETLDDCDACHLYFSKGHGVLAAMKQEGTLGKKQVMNQVCLQCHRNMKKAKEKTGPITCKGCHGR